MKRFFLVFTYCLFAVSTSCSGPVKKQATPAAPNLKKELSRAEIDHQSGANTKAINRLQKIIAQHAETDAADDAHILMGSIYYSLKKFNESYQSYIAVINSEFFSPREVEASIGAANSLEQLGRYDEALALTGRAIKYKEISSPALVELYTLRYRLQSQLGDRLDAARSLVFLANNLTETAPKEKARIRALEFVESRLQDKELEAVARGGEFDFLRPFAMNRVALSYFEQRDYSRSETYFRGVIKFAEGSELATTAQSYIDQIEARRRVAPFTIGAVLPLTGPYAARAQESLRGLELGLGIRSVSSAQSDFKIAVLDSEANPDVARRAVERLVIEDSVIAIVGDILSKTAEAVATKADELGVPVITMSQKSGLTQLGDAVFQNAMTSNSVVSELVASAMNQNGLRRFAILYPNNGYGVEYANVFWDEVLKRGGQIVAAQSYSPTETDFSSVISRLAGTYYLEDRADEYSIRVKNWYAQQRAITSRVTPPRDLLPPIIDFDAIFIPDGIKALSQITSMLKYSDVDSVKLLGTNIWNVPALVERGTQLIEGSLFVDSKAVVDPKFKTSRFFTEYIKLYGEPPNQFQAQAYDIGVALRHVIERGSRSRTGLRDSLIGLSGVSGSSDDVRVGEDKEFTRPLSVLTVKDGKIAIATDSKDGIAR